MSYAILASAVVGIAGLAAAGMLVIAGGRHLGRTLGAMGITALVIGVLTAVFDSIMIAAGLFQYVEEHLLGLYIGLAPIEDFSYVIAATLLLPALWLALGGRRVRGRTAQGPEAPTYGALAGRERLGTSEGRGSRTAGSPADLGPDPTAPHPDTDGPRS